VGVLVAGLSALPQRNIKRVLAYSTMSQLGYMFLALGIGAWSGAIFHLVTHAFFKSLLFLGAGVVILAVNHEHDIYAMGGMARKSPFTFWTFLVAALTLAAIPPTTAGFSSKDLILTLAWQSGGVGRVFYVLGLAGVFVTSVYIFRVVFIVFAGSPRTAAPAHGAGHGQPAGGHGTGGSAAGRDGMQAGAVMGIPLAILAVLCLAGGFLALPHDLGGSPHILSFLQTALPAGAVTETPVRTEWILQGVSEAASLLGIPVAYLVYRRNRSSVPAPATGAARFLFGGWGFDWLYDRVFVRPFVWLARINTRDVVDRIFDGVGGLFMVLSRAFRWTQNGRVRWYAAGLAVGAVLIVAAVVLL
jgi:NADH-quinone oxidoreductase subunit L